MRVLVALVSLTLLATASAQVPGGGNLSLTGLPDTPVTTNQTQAAIPFGIQVTLDAGTCAVVGGTVTVDIVIATSNNVSAVAEPARFTFPIGAQSSLPAVGSAFTAGGVILVDGGVVSTPTQLNATVTGMGEIACVGVANYPLTAEQVQPVEFQPIDALQNGAGVQEAMPGFELVALVAALGVALVVMGRRN